MAAIVLLLAACGDSDRRVMSGAAETKPTSVARNGKIAFVRGGRLYLARPDGKDARPVTPRRRPGAYGPLYSDPAWSPDGARLALTVTTFPTHEYDDIAVVDGRSGRLKRLTGVLESPSSFNFSPSWSPEGSEIVFSALVSPDVGGSTLHWVATETREIREMPLPDYDALYEGQAFFSDEDPAWSPNGEWICFARVLDVRQSRRSALFLVRPDGSELHRIGDFLGDNPDWAPDGRKVAFDDGRDIYIVDADGSEMRRLTDTKARESDPVWSPDGRYILFGRETKAGQEGQVSRERPTELWVTTVEAGRETMLIRNGSEPDWQPLAAP